MLGKNMAVFLIFLLGSCDYDVGELLDILGQMFARKCVCVSVLLQLHPFCA